ncbi:MAG TPA: DUF998 domain-containing protein [Actinocrinis sp.]|uniref:DUF998 domain-containing protein n=1 Tax=Actinocrinis sp. TaxID=1920516 RepID=UPI002D3D6AFB|nr:DUF998 domain-containing protein [Actinocrinis sp.]HZU59114.1 DUF998 domain-containing protein [Actinocrinis sp.]
MTTALNTPAGDKTTAATTAAGATAAGTLSPAATYASGVSTRALLGCVALAFPLWGVVSLAQAATRRPFNITRHPLSILSNGTLGWIQITNFVLCGVLALIGSAGLRRALSGAPGGRWVPRLVAGAGAGMIAAGVFRMDPDNGFPAGAPTGTATTMSWHSALHMVSGTVSFAAIIAACFVLGRHFGRAGDRARARVSRIAAVVFILGDGWAMTGGAWGSLTLAVGALTGMLWVSLSAYHLRGRSGG